MFQKLSTYYINTSKNPIIKPNKNNHPIVGKPHVELDDFWYCISSMCLGILLYVSNAHIWYLFNTSLHFFRSNKSIL